MGFWNVMKSVLAPSRSTSGYRDPRLHPTPERGLDMPRDFRSPRQVWEDANPTTLWQLIRGTTAWDEHQKGAAEAQTRKIPQYFPELEIPSYATSNNDSYWAPYRAPGESPFEKAGARLEELEKEVGSQLRQALRQGKSESSSEVQVLLAKQDKLAEKRRHFEDRAADSWLPNPNSPEF